MPRILRKITKPFRYWYYWIADYFYAGFWQLAGYVRKTDTEAFLALPEHPRGQSIILLPGIYEKWDFMKPIARTLLDHDYPVHVIEGLGLNDKTVEEAAEIVDVYIRDHALRQCIIVAHSKGGLIGKYLMSHGSTRKRILGMAALNTPFGGSVYARVIPFSPLRIFSPSSLIMKLLARDRTVNRRIYSIYSAFDPHIPGGSRLEGAVNRQLATYGHFKIIKDARAHAAVLDALAALAKK